MSVPVPTGASAPPADDALVPARILNEHVYCPRLAWLEWEAKAFVDNYETVDGRDVHRRVDEERGTPPDPARVPEGDSEGDSDGAAATVVDEVPFAEPTASRPATVTALAISSPRLGLTAKLDRVDFRDGTAIPVETKRGAPRKGGLVVWEPEHAQLTAQALLLREQGHAVSHTEIYFAETRTRHEVSLPDEAETWITGLVREIRTNAAQATPPPPLVDSPKCPRCSLVGVCLPDETNLLRETVLEKPRRIVARDDPRAPLYVMTPGAFVKKKGGRLELEFQGETQGSRRLIDIAHLAVFGNVTVSSGAMRACLEQDTPVLWFSSGGWLSGYAVPHGGSWVARRMAQTAIATDLARGPIAAAMVAGKLRNQRTMLRRLGGDGQRNAVAQLGDLVKAAEREVSPASLLGIEGTGARIYFEGFQFEGRNRRPPTDPVNAMLSFAYALLVRDTTVACLAAGLYVCDLTRQELVKLRASLRKEMNLDEDHVAIFDLGPPQGRASRRVEHLGRPPKTSDPDEPAIW